MMLIVKRIPAALTAAAVLLLFVSSTASASGSATTRPASKADLRTTIPARVTGDVVPVYREGADAPRLASRVYATTDTIAVFTDSLETWSSPGNEGKWTHVDQSFQPTAWNISTLFGCGGHAFWCGIVDSSWTGDANRRGYANSWEQTLENYVDLAGASSPYTISFDHRMNVESGFDYGTVEIFDRDDLWLPVGTFSGVIGPSGCANVTLSLPDSSVVKSNPVHFRFRFHSNNDVSSEDGLYSAGEGWAIDNVTVKGGPFDVRFFDDMEAGMGTWTRSTFLAVGDYWLIQANPITQQVCTTNTGKVWRAVNTVTGALVARQDDKLISPPVAVSQADQVFLFFDTYRSLPFDACFYYDVNVRTRNAGDPGWSAWADPTGLLYFGAEHEWMRQTVALTGAGGVDSVQFQLRVKDWGPVFCGGSQTTSGTDLMFDNFKVGTVGASGPSLAVNEVDLYNDTFRATAFNGNDNFNTPSGDSVAVRIGAANGLKTASMFTSVGNMPFSQVAMVKAPNTENTYTADVPAGNYARGTVLRYYFSATDSLNQVATLPADALGSSHYLSATILPGVYATSGVCPDDTARVLYVNGWGGPDLVSGVVQSLAAIGARFDRFDINAPELSAGNSPGGGSLGAGTAIWPAAPLGTLGAYRAIVWDVGDRNAVTLSAADQSLLTSWLSLPGKNRGLFLAGDNLAYDLLVNGQGISNFLSCTLGAAYTRDVWENAPQDTLVPIVRGATGTRIANEPFSIEGGCPVINAFDATSVSSCVGANGRVWLRYPNNLAAATERQAPNGPPNGDSLRAVLAGFSLGALTDPVRRNLLLYRTLVQEFEVPSCYTATGIPDEAASPVPRASLARLYAPSPNPFNPHTAIRFGLARDARVKLRVFAVDGSLVRTLADRSYEAGEHEVSWDGRDAQGRETGSGAYFVSLEADGVRAPARKVILLR
jgi:hypothetical protein